MKKMILILLLSVLTWTAAYGQSIHFICFADTDDDKIGKGVAKDVTLMLDFVMSLAEKLGMEENLKPAVVMMGDDCSPQRLKSVIRDFTCGPKDVVMFYYSGHGVRSFDDTSVFPQMCLGSNTQKDYIPLEYVKDELEKKGAKLLLVMGNCCNSYSNVVLPKDNTFAAASWSPCRNNSSRGLKKLFLETKGTIIASGSKKGQYSWTSAAQGGLFTLGFLKELDEYASDPGISYNWNELMRRTSLRVEDISRKALKEKGGYIQTPIFRVEHPVEIAPIRLDEGIGKALTVIADQSLPQTHRIKHYESVLKTFFVSDNCMIDIVGQDRHTIIDYRPASQYLLRVATVSSVSDFKILEQQKDASGKISYLKILEIH